MALRVEQPLDLPDPRSALPRRAAAVASVADRLATRPTLRLAKAACRTRSGSLGSICGRLVTIVVGRRGHYDASGGKRLARPAQHPDAFKHGAERGPLQAVMASDNRQRQADTPAPMRRKCRI